MARNIGEWFLKRSESVSYLSSVRRLLYWFVTIRYFLMSELIGVKIVKF